MKQKLAILGEAVEAPSSSEAEDNANNVVANRVAKFLDYYEDDINQMLQRYRLHMGLTQYDISAMLAQMHGNPKPIVIAPEPIEDAFTEEEREEMRKADEEIEYDDPCEGCLDGCEDCDDDYDDDRDEAAA